MMFRNQFVHKLGSMAGMRPWTMPMAFRPMGVMPNGTMTAMPQFTPMPSTFNSLLIPSVHRAAFSTFQIKFNKNERGVTEVDCLKSIPEQPIPECYYPQYQDTKVEGPTAKANNYNVRHSIYKLLIISRAI